MNYLLIQMGAKGFHDEARPPTVEFLEMEDGEAQSAFDLAILTKPDGDQLILYSLEGYLVNKTFERGMIEGHWMDEFGGVGHKLIMREKEVDNGASSESEETA